MATHEHSTAPAGGKQLPTISEIHLKTVHLHGLLAVLGDSEPHDKRTRNGRAALISVTEDLADEVCQDLEMLMETGKEEAA